MENNFYRNLKLPFEFDVSFSSWIKSDKLNIFRLERDFLGDEFSSFLEKFNYRIFVIHAFCVPSKSFNNFNFKVDTDNKSNSRIVVKYGSKSSIKFWNLKSEINPEKNKSPYGQSFFTASENDLELLSEFEQQKVSLVNGDYFQTIYNDTDYPVYIILVDLYDQGKNCISWKQALKDLNNYIV